MTNELEKQFFDTFGIEPIACNDCIECYEANTTPFPWCEKLDYPQITDRILLELICILNDYGASYLCYRFKRNIDDLKKEILTDLIFSLIGENNANKKTLKQQVQALFEEG